MTSKVPSRISVRRRLLGMLALTCGALALSLFVVRWVQRDALEARAAAGVAAADAALATLAERVEADTRLDETAALLGPLRDASAGVCAHGAILWAATIAPPDSRARYGHREDGPPRLLPLDHDAVLAACESTPAGGDVVHHRGEAPLDLLSISTRSLRDGRVAFVLARQPIEGGPRWLWMTLVATLVGLALGLAWMTRDTLSIMGRSAESLRAAMRTIPHDPHADPGALRAEEFATVAAGLAEMTRELAAVEAERRALEQKLNHEARLASLGRVVAGVAHEVRNPLAAMKLRLDGMQRRGPDERTARDVAVCLDEIARLDRLVRSLLLASQTTPRSVSVVDLGALVRERVEALEARALEKRVSIRERGAGAAPADRDQILRVLDNLLLNALEASPEGGSLDVELREARDEVELVVSDDGEGLPPAHEGELFEPFFTLRAEGTGLGLFTSRAIVRAHGGDIGYRRDGGRTSFWMKLKRSA